MTRAPATACPAIGLARVCRHSLERVHDCWRLESRSDEGCGCAVGRDIGRRIGCSRRPSPSGDGGTTDMPLQLNSDADTGRMLAANLKEVVLLAGAISFC